MFQTASAVEEVAALLISCCVRGGIGLCETPVPLSRSLSSIFFFFLFSHFAVETEI